MFEMIEQKGMPFDHDICYPFSFSSSLFFEEGKEKDKWITKVVAKSHAILLDCLKWKFIFLSIYHSTILVPFLDNVWGYPCFFAVSHKPSLTGFSHQKASLCPCRFHSSPYTTTTNYYENIILNPYLSNALIAFRSPFLSLIILNG